MGAEDVIEMAVMAALGGTECKPPYQSASKQITLFVMKELEAHGFTFQYDDFHAIEQTAGES